MITYTNIPLVLYFMNDSTQVSGQSGMQYYTSKSRMQYYYSQLPVPNK
jgi:hypothetical protein